MATMKNWTGVEGQGSRTVKQFTTFQWIDTGHLSFCSVSTSDLITFYLFIISVIDSVEPMALTEHATSNGL